MRKICDKDTFQCYSDEMLAVTVTFPTARIAVSIRRKMRPASS